MNKLPRLTDWFLIAAVLVGAIMYLAPQNGAVDVHKLSLVGLAIFVGYWASRSIFPYARPHSFRPYDGHWTPETAILFVGALLARSILMAAIILAVALGL